jgi:hypothetical protein
VGGELGAERCSLVWPRAPHRTFSQFIALSSSHFRFNISLRDPEKQISTIAQSFGLTRRRNHRQRPLLCLTPPNPSLIKGPSHLRLRRCSPTFRHISPPEVSLHNRRCNQGFPALPPGPPPSLLTCKVYAKLLLPTRSKMTRTTKTHRMYQMSFAHTTQKKVAHFHHGYHRTRRSPQWRFRRNRIINTVNLETIIVATE